MQAGFDTSVIAPEAWERLLNDFDIDTTPSKHIGSSGWHWWNKKGFTETYDNHVVTAYNPFTGEHYNLDTPPHEEPGLVSYVGIEGDSNFVADFFVAFKEVAEYIKDEEFGQRNFI